MNPEREGDKIETKLNALKEVGNINFPSLAYKDLDNQLKELTNNYQPHSFK